MDVFQDLPDSHDYRAHSMMLHVTPVRGVFRPGVIGVAR